MRPVKAILFEPNCLADAEGPFEDVAPAFAELRAMGIQLDTTADPAETLYITDNAAGLTKAKAAGMIPILLMHNPDEAMRLVANNPAGGIVSLLELPDLIRFVSAQSTTHPPSPLLSAP
jgi:beta-phosphoglucomutase-like phosphatase (HAD superfamily)